MKAQEARHLTEQAHLSLTAAAEKTYQKAIKNIEIAAKGGDRHIYLYLPPGQMVMKRLQDDGYMLDESNHRNEYLLTIKW